MVAAAGWSVNEIALGSVKLPNKRAGRLHSVV